MTALLTVWQFLTGNRIARAIGGLLAGLLAILGYGALKERKGAQEARKQAELDQANANVKAERERVNLDAELDQEADLLARARRVGVVRKDRP